MATELTLTPLDQLHFDPDNPRLPERLKGESDSAVLEYLLLECNLIELMMSIGEQGYFDGEPLMIVPRAGGGYIVVEGNRRLGALKLLASDGDPPAMATAVKAVRDAAKQKPTDIPTLIYQQRSDILTYLGYRHITGIKEWDALAKARYLRELRKKYDAADDESANRSLAKEIGSRASTVAKLLTGYELLERARDLGILQRIRVQADDIPFSLLTTGIGWQDIAHFIGLESPGDTRAAGLKPNEFEEFFRWVFEKGSNGKTALGESRNFVQLARVVKSEAALSAIRRGDPLDTADLLTSGPLEALRGHLFTAEKAIHGAQSLLSIADGITREDVDHADRVRKAAQALAAGLKSMTESLGDVDA